MITNTARNSDDDILVRTPTLPSYAALTAAQTPPRKVVEKIHFPEMFVNPHLSEREPYHPDVINMTALFKAVKELVAAHNEQIEAANNPIR